MLLPPIKGIAPMDGVEARTRPRKPGDAQVKIDALADWIEGCITFVDEEISQSDVADVLVENNIYQDQDEAKFKLSDAWRELRRRESCLGAACPYMMKSMRITRQKSWKRTPAYSFCLMLSLQVAYRSSLKVPFGMDYNEQGLLFERLTAEVLEARGWSTYSTGWSKCGTDSMLDKVQGLAAHLGEACRPSAVDRWSDEHAKDGGLDVVCHLPFADSQSGRPILYVQCASGAYWMSKRSTPNLRLWEKLLDLSTEPRRAIAIPFVLLPDEFRKVANWDALALLLDRHRISSSFGPDRFPSLTRELAASLNRWTDDRLKILRGMKIG